MQNGATPYLLTGDSLTGIPFLVNIGPKQDYHRVWAEIPDEDEAVALDIAFPPTGLVMKYFTHIYILNKTFIKRNNKNIFIYLEAT